MGDGVMKEYKLKLTDLHVSIHWVARGTGTPKDKDEVNRRKVCEWVMYIIMNSLFFSHVCFSLKRRDLNDSYTLGYVGRNNSETSSGPSGHAGGTRPGQT
jgi:hypothetical protein